MPTISRYNQHSRYNLHLFYIYKQTSKVANMTQLTLEASKRSSGQKYFHKIGLVNFTRVHRIHFSKVFSPKHIIMPLNIHKQPLHHLNFSADKLKLSCFGPCMSTYENQNIAFLVSKWPLHSDLSIDTSHNQLRAILTCQQSTEANECLRSNQGHAPVWSCNA